MAQMLLYSCNHNTSGVGTFPLKTGFRQGSGNNLVITSIYPEKWYLPGNMWE